MKQVILKDELNIENNTVIQFLFNEEFKIIMKNYKEFFNITKSLIVDLTLTDDKTIKELNKKYRLKDKPTDVLSFDFNDSLIYKNLPFRHMGEIVMSVETISKQAKEYNHSAKREYCYLFAHGLVHLMGYDHEEPEERKIMNNIVDKIIEPLNISREK